MKTLTSIILLGFLAFSCSQQQDCSNGQQDSGELGVDCGGSCPPCPVTTPATPGNSTLQDIQGLWYNNAWIMSLSGSIDGGSDTKQMKVFRDPNCKVDFSTDVYPSLQDYYYVYGSYGACNYPTSNIYTVNSNNNTVLGYSIKKATADSLQLSNSSYVFYLSKTPTPNTNTATVNWEVDLSSPYPNSNQFAIRIRGYGFLDTIYVVPGQTHYSGTKVVVLTSSAPFIDMSLTQNLSNSPTTDLISIYTKMSIVGTDISSSTGPHTFCSGTVCSGYDLVSSSLNHIDW